MCTLLSIRDAFQLKSPHKANCSGEHWVFLVVNHCFVCNVQFRWVRPLCTALVSASLWFWLLSNMSISLVYDSINEVILLVIWTSYWLLDVVGSNVGGPMCWVNKLSCSNSELVLSSSVCSCFTTVAMVSS